MNILTKNYLLLALCGTCMQLPLALHAQEAADTIPTKFFNATDYIRQKRYIPAGREIDPQAKGRNYSLSIFGGVGKLAGATITLPATKEFGLSVTKDVSSFNAYRLTVRGGMNDAIKQGGVEFSHLFRLSDYLMGYKAERPWVLSTVIGIGGYGSRIEATRDNKAAFGAHGGLNGNFRINRSIDLFLEPRVNLFTDQIDGVDSRKRFDVGLQFLAGLTYRFTQTPGVERILSNEDAKDNLFYEWGMGVQGDFSAAVRKSPLFSNNLSLLGPSFSMAMGKWYAPLGIRGGFFGGFHKTVSDDHTYTVKEGYFGGRLEALLNLNRLFNHSLTDPKLEVNLFGGYEVGLVAHRGETYARKVRPFHGPTAGGQLVYAVNSRIGVFGQLRWSQSDYTQHFVKSKNVEDRRMQNVGFELGVQYRRRAEDLTNKYQFTPYNFASVAIGASYPTRTGEFKVKNMMKHLGQQVSVSYGRRWSRYSSVRGTVEVGHLPYATGHHTYPLTLGVDYLADLSALAAEYNPERICSVELFAGILYTHHKAAKKNYFGMQGGFKENFRVNDRWGLFLEEGVRTYKHAIIPGARTVTKKDFSLMPFANMGVNYFF